MGASIQQDTGNPLEIQALSTAITFYQRCSKIICDDGISRILNQCKQELEQRQQFEKLVKDAESQAENRFYQKAISGALTSLSPLIVKPNNFILLRLLKQQLLVVKLMSNKKKFTILPLKKRNKPKKRED